MSRSFNWSQFRLGVYIQTTPGRVYRMLATAGGLEKWFPHRACYERRGGARRLKSEPARKSDRYYMWLIYSGGVEGEGRVLDARKDRLMKWTFGAAGRVTFTLKKSGRGTFVELVQHGIPATARGKVEFHMGCRTGWTFFLTNLKSVLERGPDLRETDPERAKNTALVNM